MKIQQVNPDNQAKAYALLRQAFPKSNYEVTLVQKLRENQRDIHEWICVHRNKAIAYIAFTNAYHGSAICGLHLGPMAVAPEMQKQGVGTELLNFALRQAAIKSQPLYVLGHPSYYAKFGFALCKTPICAFDKHNAHFLSLRNSVSEPFTIGYEAEFSAIK
jgi:putative acetyltransferase